MRKLIRTTLLLLALLLPASAAAFDFAVDGIYYNHCSKPGTVEIAPPPSSNKYAGDMDIPATVTYNGTTYTVTAISKEAFYLCFGLTSVNLPNTITAIGDKAFKSCSKLTSVTIPNSVTSIGESAFYDCSALTSIDIPNSVTAIRSHTFVFCSSLASVTIGNSVTSIGGQAFAFCYELRSVNIPNSVTFIGHHAFEDCTELTSLTIPGSVTSIDEGAFRGCKKLTTMTIPRSVTFISVGVFSYCSGLTSLTVENGNPRYDSRGNCNAIFETSSNTLIAGCQTTVFPGSVSAIGTYAFAGCTGLTSVTIPGTVAVIGKGAYMSCSRLQGVTIPSSVANIGPLAFAYCDSLSNIVVESGNPTYDSRNNCNAIIETASNILIEGSQNTVIPNSVKAIGDYAFSSRKGLNSLTIPGSVTSIGQNAFYECSGLTSINIPESVTSIGSQAFFNCNSLASVTIPGSVTAIGESAFVNCDLSDVYSYITDVTSVPIQYVFLRSDATYSGRTLHVLQGTAEAYQANKNWGPYFDQIVDDLMLEDYPQGDVNHDNEVNIADVNALIDIILSGGGDTSNADVNGDSEINIADVNALIDIILGGGSSSQDDHDYVDLGLPSGTLWATMNVGASSPEDYGDYFAWGETAVKEDYQWSTYKWYDFDEFELTKYCYEDGLKELVPEDDAAYTNWGPSWRMPSLEQINELSDYCTWQQTTMNGVVGMLGTGPNGNTLFLPATGYHYYTVVEQTGVLGLFWTRTLFSGNSNVACSLDLFSGNIDWGNSDRCSGVTVRPVRVSP
ncbi:MAG: leucine-rich repeat protein [Muribaculaceae bacterium]|nr:leucine-rich repeat protein [Muribaculaceae bacterium]